MFHLLASLVISLAAPEPLTADIAWVAEGGFCEPETVLPLPDNTLLVSNVCGFSQRGSGYLSLLNANGEVLDWQIVTNLDSPLGMAMHDHRLYLIDYNRLKIFSWPEFELIQAINLETTVANDLAISPEGVIFVSDTVEQQVIKLLPSGEQSVLTSSAQFKNANGMGIHNGFLYVGGERLWRVNLQSGHVEAISPDWMSDIDGIEFESDGTIQVTPVGGALIRYHDKNNTEIIGGPGISSANHGYSEFLQLILIPTGFDNTVIAIRVPSSVQ